MHRDYSWWLFMSWNRQRSRTVGFYDFLMFGIVRYRTEIVRWDHPGKELVEKYFRDDTVRRKV